MLVKVRPEQGLSMAWHGIAWQGTAWQGMA